MAGGTAAAAHDIGPFPTASAQVATPAAAPQPASQPPLGDGTTLPQTPEQTLNGGDAIAPQTAGLPLSGGDATGQTASGGDATGRTLGGGDATGQTVSGGDATGQALSGGDATGQTVSGGDATGQALSGGDAAGQALSGGNVSRAWRPPRGDVAGAVVKRKARPVGWVHPNPAAAVTSCFGPRGGRRHAGLDLAAPAGSLIVAAGGGVVVRAGADGGYGNAVLINHGDGYFTLYGHLAAVAVAAGQRVTAGQWIGDEGSTGHSTGPHLHFEVHAGAYPNPVEPTGWLHGHGVGIAGCAAP